uniref:TSA: Wollemia nobilis Ref_Wollemi_Transcript_13857_1326 transcribed RNA sequence n=1 Tax=Wollemia nobilis TaxID=56998 RepID=A0A0C9S4L6_9CONI
MYNTLKLPNRKTISIPVVQELAAKDPHALPQRYIRSHDERPPSLTTATTTDTYSSTVPTIDMVPLLSQDAGHPCRQQAIDKLAISCQEWGFFQVVNHGIPASLMDQMKGVVRGFFHLPLEEKLKYGIQEREGYGQFCVVSDDQKLDWSDSFYLLTLPPDTRNMVFWPTTPVEFREIVNESATELQKLYEKLLSAIAETLGIEFENFYAKENGKWTQSMKMNYYPPCPRPDLVLGICPHSDSTSLTILLQDDDALGLHICKDGEWVPVPPTPGALVINIGDMLEVMSNGRYKSIEHLAVPNEKKERISIATLWLPKAEVEVGPHPKMIDEAHPPLYTTFKRGEFDKNFFQNKLERKSTLEMFRVK